MSGRLVSSLTTCAYVALLSVTIAYGASTLGADDPTRSRRDEIPLARVTFEFATGAPGVSGEVSFLIEAGPRLVEAFVGGHDGRLSCASPDSQAWTCRLPADVQPGSRPPLHVYPASTAP